jgi:hypothetical protein
MSQELEQEPNDPQPEFGDYCKIRIVNTLTGEECGVSLNDFIQHVAESLRVTFPQIVAL